MGKGPRYKQTHYIHQDLLIAKSGFFRACLTNPFEESTSGEVKLPEDDPEAFQCFVSWLYGRPLTGESSDSTSLLFQVYILADRLMCNELCNDVMDMLQLQYGRVFVFLSDVQLVVDHNHQDSKLGCFLIEQLACDMALKFGDYVKKGQWTEFYELGVTQRVMKDMVMWQGAKIDKTVPQKRSGCDWHVHETRRDRKACPRWDGR